MVCPACENDSVRQLFSKHGYNLVQCNKCLLAWVDPLPSEKELDEYYNSSYQLPVPKTSMLSQKWKQHIKCIEKYCTSGNILDIGCSYGQFLAAAQERGWNAWGIELSHAAASYARKTHNLQNISNADLRHSNLPADFFQAITAWHVIEHDPQPASFLESAHQLLAKNGCLFLTTPNLRSLMAKVCREDWEWIVPPAHLFYFSISNLSGLLKKHGFNLVKTITQKGDSIGLFPNLLILKTYASYRKLLGKEADLTDPNGVIEPHCTVNRFNRKLFRSSIKIASLLSAPFSALFDPLINRLNSGPELMIIAQKK